MEEVHCGDGDQQEEVVVGLHQGPAATQAASCFPGSEEACEEAGAILYQWQQPGELGGGGAELLRNVGRKSRPRPPGLWSCGSAPRLKGGHASGIPAPLLSLPWLTRRVGCVDAAERGRMEEVAGGGGGTVPLLPSAVGTSFSSLPRPEIVVATRKAAALA